MNPVMLWIIKLASRANNGERTKEDIKDIYKKVQKLSDELGIIKE